MILLDEPSDVKHQVFHSGPLEYEMPGKSLEQLIYGSSFTREIAEVIDRDLRLTFGILSDFQYRFISDERKLYTNGFANIKNVINSELSNRIILPEISIIILDMLNPLPNRIISDLINNAIRVFPNIYEYVFSKSIRYHPVNEEIGITKEAIDNAFLKIENIALIKIRHQCRIDEWFDSKFKQMYNEA